MPNLNAEFDVMSMFHGFWWPAEETHIYIPSNWTWRVAPFLGLQSLGEPLVQQNSWWKKTGQLDQLNISHDPTLPSFGQVTELTKQILITGWGSGFGGRNLMARSKNCIKIWNQRQKAPLKFVKMSVSTSTNWAIASAKNKCCKQDGSGQWSRAGQAPSTLT